jgi:hypothetical protein
MFCYIYDTPPNSLMNLIVSPKGENNERIRSWGMFPNLQHFGGRRVCYSFKMRTKNNNK